MDSNGHAQTTIVLPSTIVPTDTTEIHDDSILVAKYNYYNYVESTSKVIPIFKQEEVNVDIFPLGGSLIENNMNIMYVLMLRNYS